jgi:H+-transporting ATPase
LEAQTDNEALMQTDLQIGLDTQEVQKRLTALGYNEVPEKKENPWLRVGKRFWGIVPWMLEVAAIITFILGEYPQAGVILTHLMLSALIV